MEKKASRIKYCVRGDCSLTKVNYDIRNQRYRRNHGGLRSRIACLKSHVRGSSGFNDSVEVPAEGIDEAPYKEEGIGELQVPTATTADCGCSQDLASQPTYPSSSMATTRSGIETSESQKAPGPAKGTKCQKLPSDVAASEVAANQSQETSSSIGDDNLSGIYSSAASSDKEAGATSRANSGSDPDHECDNTTCDKSSKISYLPSQLAAEEKPSSASPPLPKKAASTPHLKNPSKGMFTLWQTAQEAFKREADGGAKSLQHVHGSPVRDLLPVHGSRDQRWSKSYIQHEAEKDMSATSVRVEGHRQCRETIRTESARSPEANGGDLVDRPPDHLSARTSQEEGVRVVIPSEQSTVNLDVEPGSHQITIPSDRLARWMRKRKAGLRKVVGAMGLSIFLMIKNPKDGHGSIRNTNPHDSVDHGDFTSSDIAVAVADGELDETRMERLREGFFALLRPY